MAQPQGIRTIVVPTAGGAAHASAPGAFLPGAAGTDYTFGAGLALFTFTGVALGTLTVHATDTSRVTCVGRAFVAADIGNTILVTAAGTGLIPSPTAYYISAVSSGYATVDRAIGTAAAMSGEGYMGGQATDFQRAICNIGNNNLYIVYVKAGTYTFDTYYSQGAISGSYLIGVGNKSHFEAFTTTPGDLDSSTTFAPVTLNIATTVTGFSGTYIVYQTTYFAGFNFVSTNSTIAQYGGAYGTPKALRCHFGKVPATDSGGHFEECVVDRTSLGARSGTGFMQCTAINCLAINCTSAFAQGQYTRCCAYNSTIGIFAPDLAYGCAIISCDEGVRFNSGQHCGPVAHNAIVNCTYAMAYSIGNSNAILLANTLMPKNNSQFGCTNNNDFCNTLASNPYPNAASGDFRPATNSAVALLYQHWGNNFNMPQDKGISYFLSSGGGGRPQIGSRIGAR